MDLVKTQFLMNSFFAAPFQFCLIWMIHMHNTSRIKYIHEKCLRLIYNNKMFSYRLNLSKKLFLLCSGKNGYIFSFNSSLGGLCRGSFFCLKLVRITLET